MIYREIMMHYYALPLIGGSIKRWCCLTTSVWRLSVAYIGPKSRTERPRKTKIGREVAYITRDSDTTLKVKDKGHQAALLTAALTHESGAAVTVRTYWAWETTATLRPFGGAWGAGAPTGRRGAGAYRVSTRTACRFWEQQEQHGLSLWTLMWWRFLWWSVGLSLSFACDLYTVNSRGSVVSPIKSHRVCASSILNETYMSHLPASVQNCYHGLGPTSHKAQGISEPYTMLQ